MGHVGIFVKKFKTEEFATLQSHEGLPQLSFACKLTLGMNQGLKEQDECPKQFLSQEQHHGFVVEIAFSLDIPPIW